MVRRKCTHCLIPGCGSKYLVRLADHLTRVHEVGGAVASWLVWSTPEQAVRVRALAGDIACAVFLGKPLSTQVYKWVPANLILGGNPAMD